MSTQEIFWKGLSGRTYRYSVFGLDTRWNDVPGNYIFARWSGGRWEAVYIGETESFLQRLPNHEKWPCARRNGVTHVHAHVSNEGLVSRRAEEADLIASDNPPCNR
jgi:hypothetical protein